MFLKLLLCCGSNLLPLPEVLLNSVLFELHRLLSSFFCIFNFCFGPFLSNFCRFLCSFFCLRNSNLFNVYPLFIGVKGSISFFFDAVDFLLPRLLSHLADILLSFLKNIVVELLCSQLFFDTENGCTTALASKESLSDLNVCSRAGSDIINSSLLSSKESFTKLVQVSFFLGLILNVLHPKISDGINGVLFSLSPLLQLIHNLFGLFGKIVYVIAEVFFCRILKVREMLTNPLGLV